MRIPEPPPDWMALINGFEPARLVELMSVVNSTSDPYHPWDQFRRRPAPSGLSHPEWWSATKLARRSIRRVLPLKDKRGVSFSYALPDAALRGIEATSRHLSGNIAASEEVTNPATRDRYLVSSLIEEAITSSQLEGAATTRRVAKDMIRSGREPRTKDERMILNNYRAMHRISALKGDQLSVDLIYEVHRIVTDGTLDDPSASGRSQRPEDERVAVWQEDTLIHEPPPAGELPARLQLLCDFANEATETPYVPPVVRAIALHFMLGYDHPFEDGNGRTARALFYWSMLRHGYWLTEFLSISRILKSAPRQYVRSFIYTEQDECDLTYFLLYQLSVLQRAINELQDYLERKAREIQDVRRVLATTSRHFNHRQLVVLYHAMKNPDAQYTVQSHMTSHNVVHETARNDLLGLEKQGLLQKMRLGKAFVWFPPEDLGEILKRRRGRPSIR